MGAVAGFVVASVLCGIADQIVINYEVYDRRPSDSAGVAFRKT